MEEGGEAVENSMTGSNCVPQKLKARSEKISPLRDKGGKMENKLCPVSLMGPKV